MPSSSTQRHQHRRFRAISQIVAIVSRHAGERVDTADYNSGKAAIATGAFRLTTFKQGIEVGLERNPDWWAKKVTWGTRPIV